MNWLFRPRYSPLEVLILYVVLTVSTSVIEWVLYS